MQISKPLTILGAVALFSGNVAVHADDADTQKQAAARAALMQKMNSDDNWAAPIKGDTNAGPAKVATTATPAPAAPVAAAPAATPAQVASPEVIVTAAGVEQPATNAAPVASAVTNAAPAQTETPAVVVTPAAPDTKAVAAQTAASVTNAVNAVAAPVAAATNVNVVATPLPVATTPGGTANADALAKARAALEAMLAEQQENPTNITATPLPVAVPVTTTEATPLPVPVLPPAVPAPVAPVTPVEAQVIVATPAETKPAVPAVQPQVNWTAHTGAAPNEDQMAHARAALEAKMIELEESLPATSGVASDMRSGSSGRPLSVGDSTEFKPIVAPPLPISSSKEIELRALLSRYKADIITPEEYQKQRAEILAKP